MRISSSKNLQNSIFLTKVVAETDEDIEEFEEVLVGQGFSLNDGWGDTQAPGMEESITEAPLRNANWIAEGLSRASTGMI